jgi:hypothetical protein
VDDFISRFVSAKKLQESLLSQQSLADSRLAQLKLEFADLQGEYDFD